MYRTLWSPYCAVSVKEDDLMDKVVLSDAPEEMMTFSYLGISEIQARIEGEESSHFLIKRTPNTKPNEHEAHILPVLARSCRVRINCRGRIMTFPKQTLMRHFAYFDGLFSEIDTDEAEIDCDFSDLASLVTDPSSTSSKVPLRTLQLLTPKHSSWYLNSIDNGTTEGDVKFILSQVTDAEQRDIYASFHLANWPISLPVEKEGVLLALQHTRSLPITSKLVKNYNSYIGLISMLNGDKIWKSLSYDADEALPVPQWTLSVILANYTTSVEKSVGESESKQVARDTYYSIAAEIENIKTYPFHLNIKYQLNTILSECLRNINLGCWKR